MRNMSFAMTTLEMYARTKSVTRRLGWDDLKTGERLMACEKCQGLGKGGSIKRIGVIECVSNTQEMLSSITPKEVLAEGFTCMSPASFVEMFCKHNGCDPRDYVNRIAFRYIDAPDAWMNHIMEDLATRNISLASEKMRRSMDICFGIRFSKKAESWLELLINKWREKTPDVRQQADSIAVSIYRNFGPLLDGKLEVRNG